MTTTPIEASLLERGLLAFAPEPPSVDDDPPHSPAKRRLPRIIGDGDSIAAWTALAFASLAIGLAKVGRLLLC